MKHWGRLFCLTAALACTACAYHSRLPRGFFAAPAAEPRVQKSVLVAADKIAQKQFVFKDYHSQNSVHSYKVDLADGALTATADALGTLFQTVEVNPSKRTPAYDYRAELHYTVGNPKTDSLESFTWFGGQPPVLETRVMLYLYDTRNEQLVFSALASRQNRIEISDSSAAAQRAESKGTLLLLPVTGPMYTQQFGENLRYTLARDLSQCLDDLTHTLERNRILFESNPPNNVK